MIDFTVSTPRNQSFEAPRDDTSADEMSPLQHLTTDGCFNVKYAMLSLDEKTTVYCLVVASLFAIHVSDNGLKRNSVLCNFEN